MRKVFFGQWSEKHTGVLKEGVVGEDVEGHNCKDSEKLEARSEKGPAERRMLDIVFLTGFSGIYLLTVWLNLFS
jgi:hypothetical protein